MGRQPCDLILMDVQMPKMDGLEATRCIRALNLENQPRVIGLSAGVSYDEIRACLAAGMNGFLASRSNLLNLRASCEMPPTTPMAATR